MMTSDTVGPKDSAVPQERAQDSTKDLVKLIMSLALGLLALSGTFASRMSEGAGVAIALLYTSWGALIACIFYGIKSLSVQAKCIMSGSPNWWSVTIAPAKLSWRSFKIGILLMILYGAVIAGFAALSGADEGRVRLVPGLSMDHAEDALRSEETAVLVESNNGEILVRIRLEGLRGETPPQGRPGGTL